MNVSLIGQTFKKEELGVEEELRKFRDISWKLLEVHFIWSTDKKK